MTVRGALSLKDEGLSLPRGDDGCVRGAPERVDFCWGVQIPLRDGILLHATAYLPRSHAMPAPCVATLTPYVADTYHHQAMLFASAGYPFLIVDVRGRGNSQGEFNPSVQEAHDGHDVVEWLAAQRWCNGKVAMWGGSYAGYAQWATAKEFPPHLATIVPAAAPFRGVDAPMRNNIFAPERVQWLLLTAGRTAQPALYADDRFWGEMYKRWWHSGRPFRDADAVIGARSPVFQQWLEHPEPDAYWDAQNPTEEDYARIDLPVLTITGAYDGNQPGALEHYARHLRHAKPDARARHFLVIGPWDHAGTRVARATFGGLSLGAASRLDIQKLHLEWYAWTMGGDERPPFLQKPVTYYMMGAEEWRYTERLADATAHHKPYYLASRGYAASVFAAGTLSPEGPSGTLDLYVYDPRSSGPEIDTEAATSGDALTDQRTTLALEGRQLVYQTAPLEAPMEVAGFFRLSAWIAIDCPDTDFYVTVWEVFADGQALRLSNDAMRARYRLGLRDRQLISTSDPLLYEFDRFTFVARRLAGGSRLRLVLAPIGRVTETMLPQRNFNAGGVVAEETLDDARVVTVRLHHDTTHSSVLHVPIARGICDDRDAPGAALGD